MADARDLGLLQEQHARAVEKAARLRGHLAAAERTVTDLEAAIAAYEGVAMVAAAGVAAASGMGSITTISGGN